MESAHPSAASPESPAADRVVELALRVRTAHQTAREFLRRYALESASKRPTGTPTTIDRPANRIAALLDELEHH